MSASSTSHYFTPRPLQGNDSRAKGSSKVAREIEIEVAGKRLAMATGEGVFCKDRLDVGSRLLLETILRDEKLPGAKRVCDLGCGWGAIGCFLAVHHSSTHVLLCDINGRAAQLAASNARQNHLQNAHAWCGNGLDAARDESFDFIACNPPIRAGNVTIQKLFEDAHRCLVTPGVLSVVMRTSQGAKSWQKRLAELFGNCQTTVIESGYRVLKCVK